MLSENNPDIDFVELEAAVARNLQQRRAVTSLSSRSPTMATVGSPSLDWKQKVRSWPYLGPVLARLYHRFRGMTAPGVGWRDRVRATPVVGEVSLWLNSQLTMPRWRRQTQSELAHAQQQLAALRTAHAELKQEVAHLRTALSRLEDKHSSSL